MVPEPYTRFSCINAVLCGYTISELMSISVISSGSFSTTTCVGNLKSVCQITRLMREGGILTIADYISIAYHNNHSICWSITLVKVDEYITWSSITCQLGCLYAYQMKIYVCLFALGHWHVLPKEAGLQNQHCPTYHRSTLSLESR